MYKVTVRSASGAEMREWQTLPYALKDVLIRGEGLEWSLVFTVE